MHLQERILFSNQYVLVNEKNHAPERHEALIPEWKDSKNVIITLRIPRIAKWILSVGHHCLVNDKLMIRLFHFTGANYTIFKVSTG